MGIHLYDVHFALLIFLVFLFEAVFPQAPASVESERRLGCLAYCHGNLFPCLTAPFHPSFKTIALVL